ncbi:MAG: hypothetical protein WBI17_01295 [Clostridiaceae bacterium]
MPELNSAINDFLTTKKLKDYFKYESFAKSTVSNVLGMLQEKYKASGLDEAEMQMAIKEVVMSYTSNKGSAIKILTQFLAYLNKEYHFDAEVKFPKIDIFNSFERQMYLAKVLQNNEVTVSSLSEELWISKRTIDDDLGRLRGNSGDPIQICGKPFVINETQRSNDRFSFASTVHPLFLTFNLTQVITTLKGLKAMGEDPALKPYAALSAAAIWQQLSDYAKDRIIFVLTNLMPDELAWYRNLDVEITQTFQTEYECRSTEGAGVVMDCIKNEKSCFVEYQNEDETTVFLSNCRFIPRSYKGESIEVTSDQGNHRLLFKKILRSAYTEDGLF